MAGATRAAAYAVSGSGSVSAERSVPGVHGLVAVHALLVVEQRRAERVVTILVGAGVHPLHEPLGAVGAEQAALLDDPEQPVALLLGRAPGREALARHWQQPAQHQLGGADLTDARPVDVRLDPLLRGD